MSKKPNEIEAGSLHNRPLSDVNQAGVYDLIRCIELNRKTSIPSGGYD